MKMMGLLNFLKRTWLLQVWILLMLCWGVYQTFIQVPPEDIMWLIFSALIVIAFEVGIYFDIKRRDRNKDIPELKNPNEIK